VLGPFFGSYSIHFTPASFNSLLVVLKNKTEDLGTWAQTRVLTLGGDSLCFLREKKEEKN
jgi:hypothetical protein